MEFVLSLFTKKGQMEQAWNTDMSSKQLRKIWRFHINELRKLEKVLEERHVEKQSKCEHVWKKDMSARSGKSHYDCIKCGFYK